MNQSQHVETATVRELRDEDHLLFTATDNQVAGVFDHIEAEQNGFHSVWVDTENGEYSEVWACKRLTPHMRHRVYRLV